MTLYAEMSPLRCKVIENQIQGHPPDRGGWRSLALQLGKLPHNHIPKNK